MVLSSEEMKTCKESIVVYFKALAGLGSTDGNRKIP